MCTVSGVLNHRFAAPVVGAAAAALTVAALLLIDPSVPTWGLAVAAISAGSALTVTVLLVRIGRSLAQSRLDDRSAVQSLASLTQDLAAVRAAVREQGKVLDETNDRARRSAQALRPGSGGIRHQLRHDAIRDADSLLTLHSAYRPARSVMPLTSYSALPSTSLLLADLVREMPDGGTVVELGGGASTVWMALASAARGRTVRIVSLDHDEGFAEKTRAAVARHGLSDVAEVRWAPLVPQPAADGSTTPWYDRGAWSDIDSIDLLFIDGPPGGTGPDARRPALEKFADRIVCGGAVVIDDADRPDERSLVDAWCAWPGSSTSFAIAEERERAVLLLATAITEEAPA